MNKYLALQYLLKILERADVKYNFLQKLFKVDGNNNNVPHMSNTLTLKVRKGVDNSAASPIKAAPNENTAATFSEIIVKTPRFREYTRLTADWAYQIIPDGTGISQDLQDMIVSNIKREQEDLMKLIETSHEIMMSQILQTGKVSMVYGDKDTESFELVLGTSPFEDVSTKDTEKWTGSCDKLKWIATKAKKITKAGYKADIVIMGSAAAELFLNDEAVMKKLDNRNINMGQMQSLGEEIGGYTYHGKMDGRDFYTYDMEYVQGGETKPFIDPRNVIVTSSMVLWEKHFSPVKDSRAFENIMAQKYFSKSWEEELDGDRMILVESDSLTACLDMGGVYCGKVMA